MSIPTSADDVDCHDNDNVTSLTTMADSDDMLINIDERLYTKLANVPKLNYLLGLFSSGYSRTQ